MKKIILFILSLVFIQTSLIARTLENSYLNDNISMTIKGGITTPLDDPADNPRGIFGIELEKKVTPIFGVGIEGEWTVNTSSWKNQLYSGTSIDHQYVGVFTTTNWMNLVGGYKGAPRKFEIETVLGAGWGHSYGWVSNYFAVKHGFNIKYNFRNDLSISLKPAVIYNLSDPTQYNINKAALQLQVGLTYHFVGKSGNRHFTFSDNIYNQQYVDELNNKINSEREKYEADKQSLQNQVERLININEELSKALKNCNTPKEAAEFIPIRFEKGSSVIPVTSDPIFENIIKNMDDGEYMIIGYASEEGTEQFNQKLSEKRAQVVKDKLVEMGVDPNKLSYIGAGATNQFGGSLESNRVVIIKK